MTTIADLELKLARIRELWLCSTGEQREAYRDTMRELRRQIRVADDD